MTCGQCRMGCHILLVPVLETGSQILCKEVHWDGGHSRRRPGQIYTKSSERRSQRGNGIVFDIGNSSRLRKLSICNRSVGSSFEASKSWLEIVSSVLEGLLMKKQTCAFALATFH